VNSIHVRSRCSKLKFHSQLNDALVSSRVVLAEVSAQHCGVACRPEIIRDCQTREIVKDRVASLAGCIGDVGRQIVSRALWMIQDAQIILSDSWNPDRAPTWKLPAGYVASMALNKSIKRAFGFRSNEQPR
jgi:hypothetical protein